VEEECDFECPRGQRVVANGRHKPSSNGCGALNVFFDETDASPVRLDAKFTGCCDQHDLCYDTCGSDKDACDLAFRKCMYAVCKEKPGVELIHRKPCKVNARAAFLLVVAVGCQMYKDAQREACECVADSRKNEL